MSTPNEAQERVLSTLNKDGSRRVIRLTPAAGRFLRWRRVTAYALIALFAALPYIKINGKPAVLLDLPEAFQGSVDGYDCGLVRRQENHGRDSG